MIGMTINTTPLCAEERSSYLIGMKVPAEAQAGEKRQLIEKKLSKLGLTPKKIDPIGAVAEVEISRSRFEEILELNLPEIAFVEKNGKQSREQVAVNDEFFASQWNLKTDAGINATGAWSLTKGNSDVVVAVIDTGYYLSHRDMDERLYRNGAEIPSNGMDDDNNGYIDDVSGYNFFESNTFIDDTVGHGTAAASIISSETNNSLGIAGVTWNTKILPLKVSIDGYDGLRDMEIAQAINYVAELRRRGHNIVAVNCSFGGSVPSTALEQAVRSATEAGVVVVAAAGNGYQYEGQNYNLDIDKFPFYPASYASFIPGVISVAATTSSLTLTNFSSYGMKSVALGAPGEDVLASYLPLQYESGVYPYAYVNGTSFAAPHVAGVVALMQSVKKLEPKDVVTLLKQTVRKIDGLLGFVETGGMVNAEAAVRAAAQYLRKFTVTTKVSYLGTGLSAVRISVSGRPDIATDAGGSVRISDVVEGTTLTFTPTLPGFTFNPPSRTIAVGSSQEVTFTADRVVVQPVQPASTPAPPAPTPTTPLQGWDRGTRPVVGRVKVAAKTRGRIVRVSITPAEVYDAEGDVDTVTAEIGFRGQKRGRSIRLAPRGSSFFSGSTSFHTIAPSDRSR